jgi:hypothetical protein
LRASAVESILNLEVEPSRQDAIYLVC